MTASTLHKAVDRATLDEPTPEAARPDVPSDLGDFPSAGEAGEEQPGHVSAHAAITILAQHEEVVDLSHTLAGEMCVIADERKAR